MLLRLFIIPMLFMGPLIAKDHSIYIALTHARATATAFEMVMRTHGDMKVLHAPFLYPYLIEKYGTNDPKFTAFLPNPTVTFDDVRDELFELARNSPVFLKESGYLLQSYLDSHPEFIQDPRVKMIILVRDPAKSILSFYKKMPTVDDSIIGHRQLWELYELLEEKLGEAPLVIDSDRFLQNPMGMLKHLGEEWEIEFREDDLNWDAGYADDWHVKDWYDAVGTSNQLGVYRGDVERLEDGTPVYGEVTNEADRERLQGYFKSQNPYYQKLLAKALK